MRLTCRQWKRMLEWFVLGLSSNKISELERVNKPGVLRALACVRRAMALDVPEPFSGIVEVDETYLGGRWVNRRKHERGKGVKSANLSGLHDC